MRRFAAIKELNESANLFKEKSGECVCKWSLRVWDNDGNDIKLYLVEFVDMGCISQGSPD